MPVTVRGLGVDLVVISDFAEQLDQPGTRLGEVFTSGERRDCRDGSSDPSRHLAARWAAKEAVIKAWSDSLHGYPPPLGEQIHHEIEVVKDAWGRPRIVLHGEVAKHIRDASLHVSLSHDGDHAIAYVTLEQP